MIHSKYVVNPFYMDDEEENEKEAKPEQSPFNEKKWNNYSSKKSSLSMGSS